MKSHLVSVLVIAISDLLCRLAYVTNESTYSNKAFNHAYLSDESNVLVYGRLLCF